METILKWPVSHAVRKKDSHSGKFGLSSLNSESVHLSTYSDVSFCFLSLLFVVSFACYQGCVSLHQKLGKPNTLHGTDSHLLKLFLKVVLKIILVQTSF